MKTGRILTGVLIALGVIAIIILVVYLTRKKTGDACKDVNGKPSTIDANGNCTIVTGTGNGGGGGDDGGGGGGGGGGGNEPPNTRNFDVSTWKPNDIVYAYFSTQIYCVDCILIKYYVKDAGQAIGKYQNARENGIIVKSNGYTYVVSRADNPYTKI